MIKNPSDLIRFTSKIEVQDPDPESKLKEGCWLWTGTHSGNGRGGGYGRFSFLGQTVAAHRWIYHFFFGKIPRKKQLDHLCHNRGCVNPNHLQPVTNEVNQRRKFRHMKKLIKDQKGATAIEWGLIAGMIAVVVILAFTITVEPAEICNETTFGRELK